MSMSLDYMWQTDSQTNFFLFLHAYFYRKNTIQFWFSCIVPKGIDQSYLGINGIRPPYNIELNYVASNSS